ncbi:MAG: hemolysin family protein [Gemmatimonadaceae bacterium]
MIIALVLCVLIAINALYVAAEFSAVSVRTSQVQHEAEGGNTLARRLLRILVDGRTLDRYVAACQIGITISSLVVGAYAQATLAPILTPLFERLGSLQEAAAQSTAAVTVLVGLTVIQMVLGELVPKSLALRSPLRVGLFTVIPMQWSQRLLSWFIDVLNGSGRIILRMLGVPESGHRHVHSAQELSYLVAESARGGLLKPNEHLRLRRALQLGERPARTLMVPRTAILALDVDADPQEVVRMAIESPYTRFPVYEGTIDQVIGIVHVRDIATAATADGTSVHLRALLRPVLIAPATMNADRLLMRFKVERRTMAVLVDEFGGTAGLITIDNILDDLIGDIADEFRPHAPTPARLPDGRVRFPGAHPVGDTAAWVGTTWDPRGASTVSGLVMAVLGRVPQRGDTLSIDGVTVEVEHVDRRMVLSVIASPLRAKARPGEGRTDD